MPVLGRSEPCGSPLAARKFRTDLPHRYAASFRRNAVAYRRRPPDRECFCRMEGALCSVRSSGKGVSLCGSVIGRFGSGNNFSRRAAIPYPASCVRPGNTTRARCLPVQGERREPADRCRFRSSTDKRFFVRGTVGSKDRDGMKMLLRKEKGGTNAVRRPFAAAVGGKRSVSWGKPDRSGRPDFSDRTRLRDCFCSSLRIFKPNASFGMVCCRETTLKRIERRILENEVRKKRGNDSVRIPCRTVSFHAYDRCPVSVARFTGRCFCTVCVLSH